MTHPIVVAVSAGAEARDAVALGVSAARLLHAPLVLAGVAVGTDQRDDVANELHRQADAVPYDVPCTIQVESATGLVAGLRIIAEKEEAQFVVVGASHLGSSPGP